MAVLIGAIADDFTGASDLANTLAGEGMRVVQVIGVPDDDTDIGDAEVVIIALKSRTAPIKEAVDQSLAALVWLKMHGVEQIIFKYCSTFDSTDKGNIGPVADALRVAAGADFSLVCPAFPENGRTIYQGHLFVFDQLLENSTMRDHPLTPMQQSNLVQMMDAQSQGKSGLINYQTVQAGAASIQQRIKELQSQGCVYGVIDAITVEELRAIGAAISDHKLVTGGSGIATGLPQNFRAEGLLGAHQAAPVPDIRGRSLVLVGSCSTATRGQIDAVSDIWPSRKIDVDGLAAGDDVVGELCAWALQQNAAHPVLIYASADPQEVAAIQQKHGTERSGELVEQALGNLAVQLRNGGFNRLISAGGETSGAIVSALNVKALRICQEIAPGVPWTQALGSQEIALALKSGNFGAPTFFQDAFEMLP
ncbi:MAG: 3-oxo-tetronate kinase [Rhizobiaceae bacterium]